MAKQTSDTKYEYPTEDEVAVATAAIEDILGGKENADEWLQKTLYNTDLGKVSLYDVMHTKGGVKLVLALAKKRLDQHNADETVGARVLEDFKVAYETLAKKQIRAYVIIAINDEGHGAIGVSAPNNDDAHCGECLSPKSLSLIGALEDAKHRILRNVEEQATNVLGEQITDILDRSAEVTNDVVTVLHTSIDRLAKAFKTPKDAQDWMNEPLDELDDRTPAEAAVSGDELKVFELIDQLAKDRAQ